MSRSQELINACYEGNTQKVLSLLDSGLDVNSTAALDLSGPFAVCPNKTISGANAFIAACAGGHQNLAEILVKKGVSVHYTTPEGGYNAAHVAAFNGQIDLTTKYLFEKHGFSTATKDAAGYNVYQAAAGGLRGSSFSNASKLEQYDRSKFEAAKYKNRDFPLSDAISNENVDAVRYMVLIAGENPRACDASNHSMDCYDLAHSQIETPNLKQIKDIFAEYEKQKELSKQQSQAAAQQPILTSSSSYDSSVKTITISCGNMYFTKGESPQEVARKLAESERQFRSAQITTTITTDNDSTVTVTNRDGSVVYSHVSKLSQDKLPTVIQRIRGELDGLDCLCLNSTKVLSQTLLKISTSTSVKEGDLVDFKRKFNFFEEEFKLVKGEDKFNSFKYKNKDLFDELKEVEDLISKSITTQRAL